MLIHVCALCLIRAYAEEGVHFERRGNGFPRGFSWFSPGDLVVVKRSYAPCLTLRLSKSKSTFKQKRQARTDLVFAFSFLLCCRSDGLLRFGEVSASAPREESSARACIRLWQVGYKVLGNQKAKPAGRFRLTSD